MSGKIPRPTGASVPVFASLVFGAGVFAALLVVYIDATAGFRSASLNGVTWAPSA